MTGNRRMVMVDDDLWEEARDLAEELSALRSRRFSISTLVRRGLRLAIDQWRETPRWEGPFPQGEPWVGFDLDGTLAHYEEGYAVEEFIGPPIDIMVDILQEYLKEGMNVAIVTARVSNPDLMPRAQILIEEWCTLHLGKMLPVTCRKDFGMVVIYDDRAKQVTRNTGRLVEDYAILGREDL